MEYSTIRGFIKALSQRKVKSNTRLMIFLFFVAVASVLWYLNKLTYEYTDDISFPLKVENMPRGKVLVGEPPKEITLQVKAYGYTLLRYKLGASLSPVYIDLEQAILMPLEKSDTKFFLLTSTLRTSIVNQLQGELQLGKIDNDSLYFEFTTLVQKKVKVIPALSYSVERQHMLTGPVRLKPDSIIISGPRTLIDTIQQITTNLVRFERISTTHSSTVPLKEIGQVGFSHRKVTITVPVEKFTEANISKSIEVRNLPDTLRLILLPRSVSVKCNVLISSFKSLSEGNIVEPYVDFNDLKIETGNQLRIRINSRPYVVKVLDNEPKYVDYIMERI